MMFLCFTDIVARRKELGAKAVAWEAYSGRLLKKPENVSSSFDKLRMRSSLFKG
jgi:hypothetical protein